MLSIEWPFHGRQNKTLLHNLPTVLKPTLSAPISNSGDSFDGRSRCPILDLIKRAPGKWQETLFYEFESRADARE